MRAQVKLYGVLAGILERTGDVVTFTYDAQYIAMRQQPLSWSMPLRQEPYISSTGLPAYFSGLVSEGWLRRVQSRAQRIDPNDSFSLLVHNGDDLPGAVTIELLDMP